MDPIYTSPITKPVVPWGEPRKSNIIMFARQTKQGLMTSVAFGIENRAGHSRSVGLGADHCLSETQRRTQQFSRQ